MFVRGAPIQFQSAHFDISFAQLLQAFFYIIEYKNLQFFTKQIGQVFLRAKQAGEAFGIFFCSNRAAV